MPMDGLTLGAVVSELNETLENARVDKVNQPENDEVHIAFFARGGQKKLLLCAGAACARLHLTNQSKPNLPEATPFCMLLRKHLTGAHLKSISQKENERIVYLCFEGRNDFLEPEEKTLIFECMGKHSNLILTDKDGVILDAIRRVYPSMSRVRQLLPGLVYVLPPSQERADPFSSFPTESEITPRRLADSFTGLSGQAAEEICKRAEEKPLKDAFADYIGLYRAKRFAPVLLVNEQGEPLDFFAVKQAHCDESRQKEYPSLSEAIDVCFIGRDKALRRQERARDLHQKLAALIEKTEKKQAQQEEKERECAEMETLRVCGELLNANLYRVPRGAQSVTLENFYDEMRPLAVPLDPSLSAAANAQKYFKKYAKLRTAQRLLTEQKEETAKELEFYTDLLDSLDTCETAEDLSDIRRALEDAGALRKPKGKPQKTAPSKPMHFLSSNGLDIYVGKNNTQNDLLTLHFALPDDLWFHTREIHGSHVILHASDPDERSVEEAAMLAAFYSKAHGATRVAVDCTKRKFVKKPAGSLPGKVIYTHQTTYFIDADPEHLGTLRRV